MTKKPVKKSWQINLLFICAILAIAILAARLVFLQVFKFSQYKAIASEQHRLFKEILPERGRIFAGSKNSPDFFPIAINKKVSRFFIVPKEIQSKENFINSIAPILSEYIKKEREDKEKALEKVMISGIKEANTQNQPSKKISESADKNEQASQEELDENASYLGEAKKLLENHLKNMEDPYEIVLKELDIEAEEKIKDLKIKGAYFAEYYKRYYPEQEFAADALGFVGFKDDSRAGRYGIEEYFNDCLEGNSGFVLGEKDTRGRIVSTGNKEVSSAKNGCDVYLTIDRNIQYKAEEALKEASDLYKIDSGSIVIINPKTGKVLAIADWPTFNSNYYSAFDDFDVFQNGAIQKVYEPGSIFKIITMAAAMDKGKITPYTKYNDEGHIKIGGRIIKNVDGKSNGFVSMAEALEKSLNTGAIFAQQSIPESDFLDYVKKFNFGKITGIELKGEVAGSISALEEIPFNAVNYAAASFGQGVSATAIEMTSAVSSMANGGILMKPYIIDKIVSNGAESKTAPQDLGRTISAGTASKISAMMVNAVKNGSASSAGAAGYNIAGKTGTAQIPENGVYTDKSAHSLAGFAPLEDPVFAMVVKLDNPKGFRFSSATAGPVFSKLAKFMLNYYGIPPEK